MRPLLRSSAFIRAAKRLAKKDRSILDAIQQTLTLLEADAFDARLRTHKLSGELAGLWACSAGYDLRIVFEFVRHEGQEAILLASVGSHDEVY
jgi:addiction module RelE/StbE family toxin